MGDEQKKPSLHIEGDWKSEAQAEKERLAGEKAEAPKLHVDADWKAQAQAEKERLAKQEAQKKPREGRGGGALPEASFRTLMSLLASQAVMGLGAMQDPQSGGVIVDLEGARFNIDLLGVLEEKTKGNLDEQEASELREVLAELRQRYVQITQAVAQGRAQGTVVEHGQD